MLKEREMTIELTIVEINEAMAMYNTYKERDDDGQVGTD
jgi:hypothetical protein